MNFIDPYKLLGVDNKATINEITKAYKVLAKKYHPDRNLTLSHNEKEIIDLKFKEITTAFNNLKDIKERRKLDHQIEIEKLKNKPKVIQKKKITDKEKRGNNNSINLTTTISSNSKKDQLEARKKIAEVFFNKGKEKYINNDIEGAVKELQTAIEKNPKISKYHSYLGLAMEKKGWDGYAQAEFKVALNFDPNDKIALENYKKKETNKKNIEVKKDDKSIFSKIKGIFRK